MNKRTSFLTLALLSNAVFSTLCGFICIVFNAEIGITIGFTYPLFYSVLGAGLLLFAIDIYHQIASSEISSIRALSTSILDFLWVAITIGLFIFANNTFTTQGIIILSSIALVVLIMAMIQLRGISLLFNNKNQHYSHRYCLKTTVDIPVKALWEIIKKMENINRYADELVSSNIISGNDESIGCIRQCINSKGQSWQEECIELKEERYIKLRFLCEDKNFPLPVKSMIGMWTLTADFQQTIVEVSWELELKQAWLHWLLMPLLSAKIKRSLPQIITKMVSDGKYLAKHKTLPQIALPTKQSFTMSIC